MNRWDRPGVCSERHEPRRGPGYRREGGTLEGSMAGRRPMGGLRSTWNRSRRAGDLGSDRAPRVTDRHRGLPRSVRVRRRRPVRRLRRPCRGGCRGFHVERLTDPARGSIRPAAWRVPFHVEPAEIRTASTPFGTALVVDAARDPGSPSGRGCRRPWLGSRKGPEGRSRSATYRPDARRRAVDRLVDVPATVGIVVEPPHE